MDINSQHRNLQERKRGIAKGIIYSALGGTLAGYKARNKFNLGPKLYKVGQGLNKGFRILRNATANGLIHTANFIRPGYTPTPIQSQEINESKTYPTYPPSILPSSNSNGHK